MVFKFPEVLGGCSLFDYILSLLNQLELAPCLLYLFDVFFVLPFRPMPVVILNKELFALLVLFLISNWLHNIALRQVIFHQFNQL